MTIDLPPSAAPLDALPPEELPRPVRRRISTLAAGSDPVNAYLYAPDVAADRARRLRAALPTWAEVCYAVKANSFGPIVAALADVVDGFEVASVSEVELAGKATSAAGRPARLVAGGPGKSEPLLRALVAADGDGPAGDDAPVTVNVESVLELHRLSRVAEEAGRRVRIALRVNPERVPVTGSLHMGGTASQFGIPEADIPDAVEAARRLPMLDLAGFHIHAVCNNLDAAAHVAYVRWCLDWSARTAAEHGIDLRVVDVGGGLGVPFQGEAPFDLTEFGARMREVEPPAGVRVVLEPGRWLVTDCGWYAAEVTDVKHSYGGWFAILRGGINHFQLPTSWEIVHNFAVLPVDDFDPTCPRPEVADTPVTVVGELCTPEDTLARDITVTRIRAGDVVVFPNAGSYGWEFAMPDFLGHPRAPRLVLAADAGADAHAAADAVAATGPA